VFAVECPAGRYGDNCDGKCACGRKSVSCDPATGQCRCRPGYFGVHCKLSAYHHLVYRRWPRSICSKRLCDGRVSVRPSVSVIDSGSDMQLVCWLPTIDRCSSLAADCVRAADIE